LPVRPQGAAAQATPAKKETKAKSAAKAAAPGN